MFMWINLLSDYSMQRISNKLQGQYYAISKLHDTHCFMELKIGYFIF